MSAQVLPSWNPRILVFACNWCSYAGADTAGVSRIQHQPHFRMIRVMCSGRVQPAWVLRAFEKGADGVLVSGCHFGDCHYIFGNHRAVEQFDKTKRVVEMLGIEAGRLRLEWISAAEGARFAQVINEFTEQVRALGPSPLATASSSQLSAFSSADLPLVEPGRVVELTADS
jgi:F420-non-reducing hydrogenase iron-sulfur subunit